MARSYESSFPQRSGSAFGLNEGALGQEERWLSAAAGACLAGYGLSRLRLGALAALGAGAFLVYRGATGYCPMRVQLADRLAQLKDRALSWSESGTAAAGPWEGQERLPTSTPPYRAAGHVDPVDEAAMESFPASDAPSHTGDATAPAVRIE